MVVSVVDHLQPVKSLSTRVEAIEHEIDHDSTEAHHLDGEGADVKVRRCTVL